MTENEYTVLIASATSETEICVLRMSSPNTVRVFKSMRMGWAGHVARMGGGPKGDTTEKTKAYVGRQH
jgi:hypothetical protein